MANLLFIGEKPSQTAFDRNWTWYDGRLAAKTLFDALEASGIDPAACGFVNLFGDRPDAPETLLTDEGFGLCRALKAAVKSGVQLVGMGAKVQALLGLYSLPHIAIRHPAARGAGRAKAAYAEHVRTTLRQAAAAARGEG